MEFKGTIGLIGARGGSKRIPLKNIKLLGNYPLIAYSIFTSRASYFIDKTIVSTDSPEIAKVAYDYEAKIIMRPKELASDTSTDYDWISHALGELRKRDGIYPENIVFLRPTSPFRCTSTVDTAISSFKKENTSLVSLEPISEAIEKTFRITEEGMVIPAYPNITIEETGNPNQMFPITYKANGYVDILRTEHILYAKSLYGNKIQSFISPKTIDIDTLEDWEYATFKLEGMYGLKE
uniref:Putative cytidylyltransferase n=1 Tax=viral metagenome TaxID=1070528 RepID=A0A6M3IIE7_9ZZZZ